MCALCFTLIQALPAQGELFYEATTTHPFGKPNPEAGAAIEDWKKMIGTCHCTSVQRNQNGTWQDTIEMDWTFRYILNGTAVQDISLKEGSLYATSIRQFHQDSNEWVVTFFSYPNVSLSPGTWRGGRDGDDIVLKRPHTTGSGLQGVSQLTFYDITDEGYRWKGVWIKDDGTVTWPFWSIDCRRKQ